jgi:hypothetical protein
MKRDSFTLPKETVMSEKTHESRLPIATSNPPIATEVVDAKPQFTVRTVGELYAKVNNPAFAGATLVLEAGTYVLSEQFPNLGRLELQENMSIRGEIGNRSAVTIDTSQLPPESHLLDPDNPTSLRISSIIVGHGRNTVEWLTIEGNAIAAGGIGTDHPGTLPTTIKIAHVKSSDKSGQLNSRGVDIRNLGTMKGRRIDVEIEDCEFSGERQGVRFVNLDGADDAQIFAVMKNVRSHDNKTGCIIANNRSSRASIEVHSADNTFNKNGVGWHVLGSLVQSGKGDGSSVRAEAVRTQFINNDAVKDIEQGGIFVVGADTPGLPGAASNNSVSIRLSECMISNNKSTQFTAIGARNARGLTAADVSGVNNSVDIELNSTLVDVKVVQSIPENPAANNQVTVKVT